MITLIDHVVQELDGIQYPIRGCHKVFEYAKDNGLVIVFGASDDLVELRGAIHDEVGACDGVVFYVDEQGVIPAFEDIDSDDKEALRDYFAREGKGKAIEAVWCPRDSGMIIASWGYVTEIPHQTFIVHEDNAVYCFGIVFDLAALKQEVPQ
jgi:hypothetical protein